jgi:SAM-dependent methyltransferase
MVSAARRLASEQGVRNVGFTVPGDEAPFPDDSFDLVNCVWVLKYILTDAGAERTIAEFCRVTKPGGYVAVIEQVNRSGSLLVESEGYYQGRALYRTPGFYIEAFKKGGLHLRHHSITNASPLFWAYSRVQRALYGPAAASPAPGLRWVTAASVRCDLLAGRAMKFRSGHHFFLFRKEGEA